MLACRALSKSLQLSNEEQLDQLLPAKEGDLELAKLPAPSRLVIYLLDGLPVLLDTSGKSDFLPTAMGLWSCPQLLPQVQLKHPAVSQFLVGGTTPWWIRISFIATVSSLLPQSQQTMLARTCHIRQRLSSAGGTKHSVTNLCKTHVFTMNFTLDFLARLLQVQT
jgi:hypothetical protein